MITKPSELTQGQQHLLKESLRMFADIANSNARAHGFYNEQEQTEQVLAGAGYKELAEKYLLDMKLSKIALIHSELGEMTEGVRKPSSDQHCPEFTSEEIEAADVFIRLMDYAGGWKLRLAEAIMAKMEYNASRPYKHGKGA